MSGVLKNIAASIAAAARSFLEIRKEDNVLNTGIKLSSAGLKWSSYYYIDWAIFGFYVFTVGAMKHCSFSFVSIFLVLWMLEIVIASLFLYFYRKTGYDITMGKNFRDSYDTLYMKSKILGILYFIGLTLKFVFWDGSERASMFFMKDTSLKVKALILLVIISATKMLTYTWLFSLGYSVFGIF